MLPGNIYIYIRFAFNIAIQHFKGESTIVYYASEIPLFYLLVPRIRKLTDARFTRRKVQPYSTVLR